MADRRGSRISSLSTERQDPSHYGHSNQTVIIWDCSNATGKNNRVAKLGAYAQTWGAAIIEVDPETKAVKVADGMLVNKDIRSQFPPEPDNHVLRLHEAKSRGRDNVWASRMIVEHSNDCDLKNRNTHWIDQCDEQNWAMSLDAFWIVRLEAQVKSEELEFNGDGFLSLLCDDGTPRTPTGGGSTRAPVPTGGGAGGPGSTVVEAAPLGPRKKKEMGALAWNIGKKAGFYTDGGPIAQLWHVLHIHDIEGVKACAPEKKSQGTLRGDVNFSMRIPDGPAPVPTGGSAQRIKDAAGGSVSQSAVAGTDPGSTVVAAGTDPGDTVTGEPEEAPTKNALIHIAIVDPPEEPVESGPDIYKVHLFIAEPSPRPPKNELNEDPVSCQPVLPRMLGSGIHGWVGLPPIINAPTSAAIATKAAVPVAQKAVADNQAVLGFSPIVGSTVYIPGRTGSIISAMTSTGIETDTITPGSGTFRATTGVDGFGALGTPATEASGLEPVSFGAVLVDSSKV